MPHLQSNCTPKHIDVFRLGLGFEVFEHPNLLIIELGAGTNIPTVRLECESVFSFEKASFIRINPIECEIPRGAISIELGGMQALEEMEKQRSFNP